MTEQVPAVSIGLPVYNGERYLSEVVDSILNQTFADLELIIADNASTDSTPRICQQYADRDPRVRILGSDENKGAAWNFNRTVWAAKGRYFKWAAHDDLHAPEFLEECIQPLEENADVVLSFPKFQFIDGDGEVIRDYDFPVDVENASARDLFRLYTAGGHIVQEIFGVFRTDELKQTPLIGPYVGSDLILLGRLALKGRFVQVPKVLFFHREHAERSAIASGDNKTFTNWYDSSKSGRFAMPRWRRLRESIRSTFSVPMSLRERSRLLYDVLRTAYWNRAYLWADVAEIFSRR